MDEQMESASASLIDRPSIATPCLLCGGCDFVAVAVSSDVAAQQGYLERFHRRRLDERLSVQSRRTSLTDRASFTHNYETHIVACRACGLLCRNPHPPAEAVTTTYIHDRYDRDHLQKEFEAQLSWARDKIPLVSRHLTTSRSPRLIEVGSFVGSFLEAGREQGWDVIGVDPGEAVVQFCRDRGLPVLQGTLEKSSRTPRDVDAVVIWNTFDQLPDPRPLLVSITKLLKPDGLLIIRIPHGLCYQFAMEITRVRRWMRTALYTALAWNNLLTFPYLYGYGLATLDSLIGEFDLIREAVYPDTLMTASVPEMKWWAIREERVVKDLCRWTTRLTSWMGDSSLRAAPWLDVYYRKPASALGASQGALGIYPVGARCAFQHNAAYQPAL
jgi:SAM-dependent methyltransferase